MNYKENKVFKRKILRAILLFEQKCPDIKIDSIKLDPIIITSNDVDYYINFKKNRVDKIYPDYDFY